MEIRTDSRVVNYLKRKIKDSRNIVAVLGIEMIVEGGGYDLDCNDENYRVEEEYGFSPEDMLSTSFFNAKVENFIGSTKKRSLVWRCIPRRHTMRCSNCRIRGNCPR